jgi:glutaminyl-tRNA synthetase
VSAADAVRAEVRLYDHLFNRPDPGADGDFLDDINPDSLETLDDALLEPSVADLAVGQRFQLERLGYFCVDLDSTADRQVINRTVTLRDTWAKVKAKAKG